MRAVSLPEAKMRRGFTMYFLPAEQSPLYLPLDDAEQVKSPDLSF